MRSRKGNFGSVALGETTDALKNSHGPLIEALSESGQGLLIVEGESVLYTSEACAGVTGYSSRRCSSGRPAPSSP